MNLLTENKTMEDRSDSTTKNRTVPIYKKENPRINFPLDSYEKPSAGFKIYAFWGLIILVCLLAWANMILTVVVFRVLHLGQGMESMELIPEQGLIKFYGDTFLDNLFKPDGKIKSFGNTPFELKGKRGAVILEVEDNKGRVKNSAIIEQNGTHIRGVKDFIVGQAFSSEAPNFMLNNRARNIDAKVTSTNHVTSEINEKLVLRSDLYTRLSGSEGTHIDGKEILWTADQQVLLKSINGSVILDGKDGIALKVKSIPVVRSPSMSTLSTQYKVCVCMPEGKLFRVPVPKDRSSHTACHNIDFSASLNPCSDDEGMTSESC